MAFDYFLLAARNVKRRGLRSWLTMLGIFIGIAAVVSLISLGQGLQDAINQQFEEIGSDKIIIESETLGPPGSASSPSLILTSKDLDVVKNVRGVKDAAGILIKSGAIEFKDELIDRYKNIKAIAVRSAVQVGSAQNAQESGFNGFLPKPVFLDELAKVITTVLGDERDHKTIRPPNRPLRTACRTDERKEQHQYRKQSDR